MFRKERIVTLGLTLFPCSRDSWTGDACLMGMLVVERILFDLSDLLTPHRFLHDVEAACITFIGSCEFVTRNFIFLNLAGGMVIYHIS